MVINRTDIAATEAETLSISRPPAADPSTVPDRDFIRSQDRHSLGVSSAGDGLRVRRKLLAPTSAMAESGSMEKAPPTVAQSFAGSGPDRLVKSDCRQFFGPGLFWGAQTGPNPTDRRKMGTKHHLLTDAQGVPLAVTITGANRHDVTQLIPLVQAVEPIAGKVGHPRFRPEKVQGDRAYDSQPHRKILRSLGIEPVLAKRNTEHGSGLGRYRWVIERTIAWLHQFRRLKFRFEKRVDIHCAFVKLGCLLICWNYLKGSF
jgi:transposase